MKPLNNNNTGCNPVSSNCVIWQGENIPCIKLCKGDSVSDTVYKLATELCDILTTLDINTYDISCLDLTGCAPDDFQGLIQLLIDKICVLNDLDIPIGGSDKLVNSTIDTLVPIAECFIYTNEYGDRVTTMSVSMYVRTIGNKICDIINQINSMNLLLSNHETRITTLENTPLPTFALANLTPVCVLPSAPTDIYSIISATERQFCELRTALGLPNDIYQAISAQCVGLNTSNALGPYGGNMSSLTGWFTNVQDLAQSYTNLWLTVCDLRAAVQNIQLNCCPTGCDGISINMTTQLVGTNLTIYLTGTIPAGFENCNPSGSLFTITDTLGASYSVRINVVNQLNAVGGTVVALAATPLTLLSDIMVHTDICLTNPSTNATCQICLEYVARSMSNCPALVITMTTDTTINYTYTVVYVPGTYTVELWNAAGTAVIASTTTVVVVAGVINGSFVGLTASTTYKIRVVADIGGNVTECAFVTITTVPVVCTAPSGVTAAFDIPLACPSCGDAIDFMSNVVATPGYYLDDDAPFLRLYDGALFDDLLSPTYVDASDLPFGAYGDDLQRAVVVVNNTASLYNGHMFIMDNANKAILVYNDSVYVTTINNITFTNPPDAEPTTVTDYSGICYDISEDKIYYGHYGGTNSYLGSINLGTGLTITRNVLGTNNFGYANLGVYRMYYNAFNNKKYVVVSGTQQRMVVIVTDPAPSVEAIVERTFDPLLANWGGCTYMDINHLNGDVWMLENNAQHNPPGPGSDSDIAIYKNDGTIAVISYVGTHPNNIDNKGIAFYQGDGSAGSSRFFISTYDTVGLDIEILEINATAPYAMIGTFIPGLAGDTFMHWSEVYNKLIVSIAASVTIYDLNAAVVQTYVNPFNLTNHAEDYLHETLIYTSLVASGANNVVILELNTASNISCPTEYATMYLTETTGPYLWNPVTFSWDPYCTYSSIVDNGDGTITITALILNNGQAMFVYSSDNGLTWGSLGGFYTAAQWALGVTFTIAPTFIFKLAILTEDNCGLSGPENTTFN